METINRQRKFGAARQYVLCRIGGKRGLATAHEAAVITKRAQDNPEDWPPLHKRLALWLVSLLKR